MTTFKGNSIEGIDRIERYIKTLNLKSFKAKIPAIIAQLYNDTFEKKVQRVFGKAFRVEEYIGGWVELCLQAGSASKFASIINASYGGESWAEEIEKVTHGGGRGDKDAIWALEHQEKIYKSFCNPIETIIFGSPISSKG